jgi:hypothetical protein
LGILMGMPKNFDHVFFFCDVNFSQQPFIARASKQMLISARYRCNMLVRPMCKFTVGSWYVTTMYVYTIFFSVI